MQYNDQQKKALIRDGKAGNPIGFIERRLREFIAHGDFDTADYHLQFRLNRYVEDGSTLDEYGLNADTDTLLMQSVALTVIRVEHNDHQVIAHGFDNYSMFHQVLRFVWQPIFGRNTIEYVIQNDPSNKSTTDDMCFVPETKVFMAQLYQLMPDVDFMRNRIWSSVKPHTFDNNKYVHLIKYSDQSIYAKLNDSLSDADLKGHGGKSEPTHVGYSRSKTLELDDPSTEQVILTLGKDEADMLKNHRLKTINVIKSSYNLNQLTKRFALLNTNDSDIIDCSSLASVDSGITLDKIHRTITNLRDKTDTVTLIGSSDFLISSAKSVARQAGISMNLIDIDKLN